MTAMTSTEHIYILRRPLSAGSEILVTDWHDGQPPTVAVRDGRLTWSAPLEMAVVQ